jgi:hypothetical protein
LEYLALSWQRQVFQSTPRNQNRLENRLLMVYDSTK